MLINLQNSIRGQKWPQSLREKLLLNIIIILQKLMILQLVFMILQDLIKILWDIILIFNYDL